MIATAPLAARRVVTAPSKSSTSASAGSSFCPMALTETISPRKNRASSKSWMVMSLNTPPDCARYSADGGAGSREMMVSCSTRPIRPSAASRWAFAMEGS